MEDRLLTDEEIEAITEGNLCLTWDEIELLKKAQDAKTLKAVEKWLNCHCSVTLHGGLTHYTLIDADVEALMCGLNLGE